MLGEEVVGMNRKRSGKLRWDELRPLLGKLPLEDPDLVKGPSVGEDAAFIRFKDGFLVVHSDPITTAYWRIGWYAIHIAANDIAVRGVSPRYFLPVVLLSPNMSSREIESIFEDMGKAARELSGVIVGGHTEFTPYLDRPIIVVTAIGYSTGRLISTSDARPGDLVLVVGRVGGEGASIIAWDFGETLVNQGVEKAVIEKARSFISDISVVKTALSITPYVNSMHDVTEGGVLQAIREIALASGVDIEIDLRKINIENIVSELTRRFGLDPLKLLSSGCLIASIPSSHAERVADILDRLGVTYSFVGRVLENSDNPRVILRENGSLVGVVEQDIVDEIYKLYT
ncbi:AIR synthase family protein [Thermogladius sp. 4427co]|uniref:AIR synthase family protein n=1 Tax=Thermogladius sp. 4427co TaxID=3450718 RepID=UPI003F79A37D